MEVTNQQTNNKVCKDSSCSQSGGLDTSWMDFGFFYTKEELA
jgi:hypothetical protein